MPVHFGPFEKFASLACGDELCQRDEKVVDAVPLARARLARCPRDRVTEARHSLADAPDECAFTAARRRTDDEQDAALFRVAGGLCCRRCRQLVTQRSAPAPAVSPLPP